MKNDETFKLLLNKTECTRLNTIRQKHKCFIRLAFVLYVQRKINELLQMYSGIEKKIKCKILAVKRKSVIISTLIMPKYSLDAKFSLKKLLLVRVLSNKELL